MGCCTTKVNRKEKLPRGVLCDLSYGETLRITALRKKAYQVLTLDIFKSELYERRMKISKHEHEEKETDNSSALLDKTLIL